MNKKYVLSHIESTRSQKRRQRRQRIAKTVTVMLLALFGVFLAYAFVTAAYKEDLRGTVIIIDEVEAMLMPSTVRTVTGYTAREDETDDTPFTTADGTDLRTSKDQVCASNNYPFETILYIDGLGLCTVHDRMAKKNNGKVDWHFQTVQEAKDWGVRTRKITKVK